MYHIIYKQKLFELFNSVSVGAFIYMSYQCQFTIEDGNESMVVLDCNFRNRTLENFNTTCDKHLGHRDLGNSEHVCSEHLCGAYCNVESFLY